MGRNQPFTKEQFKLIYSQVPRLTVNLVIKTEKGILLTLRKKNGWVGQWHMPGGTLLFQETIEQGIKRVAQEELSVSVTIEKMLGYIEYFSELQERGFGYTVGIVFLVTPDSQNYSVDEDAEKFDFFEKLPEKTILEEKNFLNKVVIKE